MAGSRQSRQHGKKAWLPAPTAHEDRVDGVGSLGLGKRAKDRQGASGSQEEGDCQQGPKGQGWKQDAGGKGKTPKRVGGRRENGKARDGPKTTAARHSPEPQGRQGCGRPTTANAGRASGLDVRKSETPAPAASRPEEGTGRLRGSEVRAEGRLRVRTTGSAPTAGKDGKRRGQGGPVPLGGDCCRGGQEPRLRKRYFPAKRWGGVQVCACAAPPLLALFQQERLG